MALAQKKSQQVAGFVMKNEFGATDGTEPWHEWSVARLGTNSSDQIALALPANIACPSDCLQPSSM